LGLRGMSTHIYAGTTPVGIQAGLLSPSSTTHILLRTTHPRGKGQRINPCVIHYIIVDIMRTSTPLNLFAVLLTWSHLGGQAQGQPSVQLGGTTLTGISLPPSNLEFFGGHFSPCDTHLIQFLTSHFQVYPLPNLLLATCVLLVLSPNSPSIRYSRSTLVISVNHAYNR
jgi:hypothetical protein